MTRQPRKITGGSVRLLAKSPSEPLQIGTRIDFGDEGVGVISGTDCTTKGCSWSLPFSTAGWRRWICVRS